MNPRLLHVTTVPMTLWFLAGHVAHAKKRGFRVDTLSLPGEPLDKFGHSLETMEIIDDRAGGKFSRKAHDSATSGLACPARDSDRLGAAALPEAIRAQPHRYGLEPFAFCNIALSPDRDFPLSITRGVRTYDLLSFQRILWTSGL